MPEANDSQVFEALLEYLRQSRGFDFSGYKRSSLMRRVKKQMFSHGMEEFSSYLDYLQVHPEEFLPLFNTILINVTAFFRDSAAWNYLRTHALEQLLNQLPEDAPIRVWSAGCASGEEAYTIAIVLAETLGLEAFRRRVKIYATDVDDEALAQARQAVYTLESLQTLPENWREKYFEPISDAFTFRSDLRRSVIFGRHNLMEDAPISRLDLLLCRNTLMYFNSEAQTKILDRFHFALNDHSMLFLGKAEMLLTHNNLFLPINLSHRLFRRVPRKNRRERVLMFSKNIAPGDNNAINQYIKLREAAFDVVPEAQIVVDRQGNLVFANAQARDTFSLQQIDQGRLLQDLEISYRPLELRSPLEQVYAERTALTVSNVARSLPNDETQYLDIQIIPLKEETGEIFGASILFQDITDYHALRTELQRANQELETANEELQSSNEELETTNEELQSTNEELETTNEELQSTNEELETINEELQSTNEELHTINDELRLRTTELDEVNAFLNSILASLRAGVVVVDLQFNILSWNDEAENLWGLRQDEVKGKSLFNLDIGLPVDQLRTPIRDCLSGKIDSHELLIDAINRRGRAIQCRVNLNLLLGSNGERQGVIVLMEEVEQ